MLVPHHFRTGSNYEDDKRHGHDQGYRYTDSHKDSQLVTGRRCQNDITTGTVDC